MSVSCTYIKKDSNTLFSFQVRDGNKGIFEVLNWYNDINTKLLDYVSTSIRESDISSFYRYIIGFKNLMRSVEYCGKAGVWGLRYVHMRHKVCTSRDGQFFD